MDVLHLETCGCVVFIAVDVLHLVDLWMCCIYSCGCVVFRPVDVLHLVDLWMCCI